jgi:hypothetical protein
VYDCTKYLPDHPGGADSITINAGMDATEEFEAIHSKKAWKQLEPWYIGDVAVREDPHTARQILRVVTWGFRVGDGSRGRFAAPAILMKNPGWSSLDIATQPAAGHRSL